MNAHPATRLAHLVERGSQWDLEERDSSPADPGPIQGTAATTMRITGTNWLFPPCVCPFPQGVHRVWVDHPWFLAKVWGKTGSKLYGPKSGADYVDNHKRFALFCKAAIESVRVRPNDCLGEHRAREALRGICMC